VFRRAVFVGLGLVALIVLAAGIAVILLVRADLRPYAERTASTRFGRPVTIQSLTVSWGDPIALDATEVHVANSSWGSTPDMVSIQRVRGDIGLWPLLRGAIRLDNVVVDGPSIVLERDNDGTGNWKVAKPAARTPGQTVPPSSLPVQFIGAMALHDASLTFRTTHQTLRIRVTGAELRAGNDNAPVMIDVWGSYNDLPVRAQVTVESFAALRQVPRPVTMDIALSGKQTTIKFNGTMRDPLGFDGIEGNLAIAAETPKEFTAAIGMTEFAARKLTLSGMLDKQGERWSWTGLSGAFDGSTVAGSLVMNEGLKGSPDNYDINLKFGPLDFQRLGVMSSGTSWQTGISMHPDEAPGETFKITLGMEAATFRRYKFDTIAVDASVDPSIVTIRKLSFGFANGRVELAGTEKAEGKGGRLHLDATVSGMDASRVLTMVGADPSTLSGKIGAGATLDLHGTTSFHGLGASHGHAIVSMAGGQLAREFLQLASTDVRVLLHKAIGHVPVGCFLAAAAMTNGIVSVSTLRLKTTDGNLFGSGQLDLRRDSLDLLIQSESRSTDFWALDIPLRISGSFTNPHAGPSAGSSRPGMAAGGVGNLGLLPQALRPPIGRGC
jgi:uncharacterized protein involved in outer membrane biogenesis